VVGKGHNIVSECVIPLKLTRLSQFGETKYIVLFTNLHYCLMLFLFIGLMLGKKEISFRYYFSSELYNVPVGMSKIFRRNLLSCL
jgi:hypothetical protein